MAFLLESLEGKAIQFDMTCYNFQETSLKAIMLMQSLMPWVLLI